MHTVIADTDVIRQLKLLACYAFRSAADKTDILVRAVILVFLFRILYGSFRGFPVLISYIFRFVAILYILTGLHFPEIIRFRYFAFFSITGRWILLYLFISNGNLF